MRLTTFDSDYQRNHAQARIDFLGGILPLLKQNLDLQTAVDLGCGVGYFTSALAGFGLRATGIDGRLENVNEAGTRHPNISFQMGDIEDRELCRIGTFDLTLCFGLLYHLENPLLALRNAFSLTNKLLLLESMRSPSSKLVMAVCDEERGDDQALRQIALYPSESSMCKMLYRAGFRHVYQFKHLPNHAHFRSTFMQKRPRTVLAASRFALDAPFLTPVPETFRTPDLWATPPARALQIVRRAWIFLRKPWPDKRTTLRRRFVARR